MAITTQELYLSLYISALGGLGDAVSRTTAPLTSEQAAALAASMADKAMLKLKNVGVTETSEAVASSIEASRPTITPSVRPKPSLFDNA